MTSPHNDVIFTETLAAIAAGNDAATSKLTMEIYPGLLSYAHSQQAPAPENLVGNVIIDAFRHASKFTGSRAQFLSTLERVIASLAQESLAAMASAEKASTKQS